MDKPTDKVIVKLDDDELKEFFGRLQPGDAVTMPLTKLTLDSVDEVPDGDPVATLSIESVDFKAPAETSVTKGDDESGEPPEPSEEPEDSAAMAVLSNGGGEEES